MKAFRNFVSIFAHIHNYLVFAILLALSVALFAIKLLFVLAAVALGYGMHAINMIFDSATTAAKDIWDSTQKDTKK